MFLHLLAEFLNGSNVCTFAVFIWRSCCCRYFSEVLLLAICVGLSTDMEALLAFSLSETPAFIMSMGVVSTRRFLAAVVVTIGRAASVEARARQRAAGGSLLSILLAPWPLNAAGR